MEQTLRIKITCPNCGRTNGVLDAQIGDNRNFSRTNWSCGECKQPFDTRVWIAQNGYVYQEALGSAPMAVYQAYNNQKIHLI